MSNTYDNGRYLFPIMALVFGGTLIFGAIMIGDALDESNKSMHEESVRIKSFIGTQVVIDKDTSTIVDIDIWNGNYILSNGKQIDRSFVDKKIKL